MRAFSVFALIAILSAGISFAQTGKIAGRITDESGAALPGVNLFIPSSLQGATSDAEGYYTILNISPRHLYTPLLIYWIWYSGC